MNKPVFLDLEDADIERSLAALGESAFRARQLIEWVYRKKVRSFAECSNISAPLREKLSESFILHPLTVKKKEASKIDGTVRYTFQTRDGYSIPAVFLPTKERNSVCISTQAGCPVGCLFCASGKVKFRRNLSRGEILDQIIQVGTGTGRRITGVLFMGMGEPLLNYDNVVSALSAIVSFRHLALGRRHVTLSTVGIVPHVRKLAAEKFGIRLALSLHAPDDDVRRTFIPETIPYSVKEILEAGLYYARTNNARLTVEYILIRGVNDTLPMAQKFVKLLKKAARQKDEVQVNLIPFNMTTGKWEKPDPESSACFRNTLEKNGVLAIIREPKGLDIGAACGQLGV